VPLFSPVSPSPYHPPTSLCYPLYEGLLCRDSADLSSRGSFIPLIPAASYRWSYFSRYRSSLALPRSCPSATPIPVSINTDPSRVPFSYLSSLDPVVSPATFCAPPRALNSDRVFRGYDGRSPLSLSPSLSLSLSLGLGLGQKIRTSCE